MPSHVTEVHIAPEPLDRFLPILGEEQVRSAARVAGIAREQMAGRAWWNVNSTAQGGGVAEMLSSLLAYTRGVWDRWPLARHRWLVPILPGYQADPPCLARRPRRRITTR